MCSRLTWLLMIVTLPISWVEWNLDTITTPYLKKWVGLAKSATLTFLYMKTSSGGLNIPSITTSYKKLQVSRFTQLLMSRDPTVHFVTDRMLMDELRTTETAFLPSVAVRDSLAADTGLSQTALKRLSQSTVVESDDLSCVHHVRSLEVEVECFCLESNEYNNIWSACCNSIFAEHHFQVCLECNAARTPYHTARTLTSGKKELYVL